MGQPDQQRLAPSRNPAAPSGPNAPLRPRVGSNPGTDGGGLASPDSGGGSGSGSNSSSSNTIIKNTTINNSTVVQHVQTSHSTHVSYGSPVWSGYWGHYLFPHKEKKSKFSFWFSYSSLGFHIGTGYGKTWHPSPWWSPWHCSVAPSWWWYTYPGFRRCYTYVPASKVVLVNWWHPYSYCRGIYRPRVTHVTYVSPRPAPIVVVQEPACPFTVHEAWEYLARGNASAALEAFACLARVHHDDGLPHIGYALANAELGVHESAMVAMRHGVRIDTEALLHVPADRRLDERLVHLLGVYGPYVHDPEWALDAIFMTASIRTMLHDASGAHFAIQQGIERGDRDRAAVRLRNMLGEILMSELYDAPLR